MEPVPDSGPAPPGTADLPAVYLGDHFDRIRHLVATAREGVRDPAAAAEYLHQLGLQALVLSEEAFAAAQEVRGLRPCPAFRRRRCTLEE